MIVPQLARCRQCKAYLQGTSFEGFVLEQVLPAQVQQAPGTATLCLLVCLFYLLMVATAGPASFLGFSSFTLVQLGAVHGPSIMLGEYWRFVTSIFGHHDIVHLALNLSALVFVGELVEQIFDRKKMMLIFLVSGVASMVISYFWYTFILDDALFVTNGASGAVSGLIGAALFGAKKQGPAGADVARAMKRWAILMVLWGFAAPGINNAAHFGGFVIGSAFARFTPLGIVKSVEGQKAMSAVLMLGLGGALVATGFMLENLRSNPVALENDSHPRSIFGLSYYQGADPEYSDQKLIYESCVEAVKTQKALEASLEKCELNLRVNSDDPRNYETLANLVERDGDFERAERLRAVGARILASWMAKRRG